MDRPVADKGMVGAGRIELRIGSVAAIGVPERIRNAAPYAHLKIAFAPARRQKTGEARMDYGGISEGAPLPFTG